MVRTEGIQRTLYFVALLARVSVPAGIQQFHFPIDRSMSPYFVALYFHWSLKRKATLNCRYECDMDSMEEETVVAVVEVEVRGAVVLFLPTSGVVVVVVRHLNPY